MWQLIIGNFNREGKSNKLRRLQEQLRPDLLGQLVELLVAGFVARAALVDGREELGLEAVELAADFFAGDVPPVENAFGFQGAEELERQWQPAGLAEAGGELHEDGALVAEAPELVGRAQPLALARRCQPVAVGVTAAVVG